MQADDPRHGTPAGYQMHRAGGEDACDRCKDAAARYERGRQLDLLSGIQRAPERVSPLGARRRLQGLAWMGWPTAYIAERSGLAVKTIDLIRVGAKERILLETAQLVYAIHEDLCMVKGPSRITRRRAHLAGWHPPLVWDDIDDPAEHPVSVGAAVHADDMDEAVVVRILGGDWKLRATVAERAEVVRRWRGSLNDLEQLTGWRAHRYIKAAA